MNSANWREQQLSWVDEPVIIQQDHDLVEYIQRNNISTAFVHGDHGFFAQYVTPINDPAKLAIWIENQYDQLFDFDYLVDQINDVIQYNLCNNGVLYIALNKFLVCPRNYNKDLPDNYDDAITEYLKTHVNADMETALPSYDTKGDEFYWVHPLTRYWFKK